MAASLAAIFIAGCGLGRQTASTETLEKARLTRLEIDSPSIYPDSVNFVQFDRSPLRDTQLTIIGVGDIMLGTNFPSKPNYLPPNNGKALLKPVDSLLQDADLTFGNMEGAISDDAPLEKRCKDTTKCYAFRMPLDYADYLKDAGFDVLSLANNHAWDFGIEGIEDATQKLDSLDIHYAGPTHFPWDTFTIKGIRYGFAAFAPNKGCCNINLYPMAVQIVNNLDTLSDVVIVSFHGGAEGNEHQHITNANEFFYGEDRGNVREFAHLMIDNGADIIFGHGPHVVRAVEVYKDRFIAYSLGNFATYGRFNLRGVNGYAPIVKVTTDLNGKFKVAKVISCLQRGEGGPNPDTEHKAYFKMKELTEADIENHGLEFDDEKQIIRKSIHPGN